MKKVNIRHSIARMLLFSVVVLLSFTETTFAQDATEAKPAEAIADAGESTPSVKGDPKVGKELFNTNCASCHKRYKRSTGPALHGITDKRDREWIYKWVHNSAEMIASGDADAVAIYEEYNQTAMNPFPQLSEADIDNILAYVEQPKPASVAVAPVGEGGDTSTGEGVSTKVMLGIFAFILLLLVAVLVLVNKTLARFAQESGVTVPEKVQRKPIWKAFVENQFLVLVVSIFFMLSGGYVVYGYFMQVGIDQGYEPVQPIHFSHRIHAGDNKIECKYCHSSARVSRTSGIPSLNVCMNCHKSISEVAPETATEDHSKEFYDGEIAKLYNAVGWDPSKQAYTGETHPVKWVKIHNLPDFVYYNHSQHVEVGGIECQQCHGEVQEMEVMRQFAPLTMGWCIDCHRETNVNVENNAYYEKIHEQLSKKYGVEALTVAQMGGTECAKCHY